MAGEHYFHELTPLYGLISAKSGAENQFEIGFRSDQPLFTAIRPAISGKTRAQPGCPRNPRFERYRLEDTNRYHSTRV